MEQRQRREAERRERSVKTLEIVNGANSKCVVHVKLNCHLNKFNWYYRERGGVAGS